MLDLINIALKTEMYLFEKYRAKESITSPRGPLELYKNGIWPLKLPSMIIKKL